MKLHIQDIVEVLHRYENRYRWLDVFASDVQELTEPSNLVFKQVAEGEFQFEASGRSVSLVLDRPRNLARFRFIKEADTMGGALVGAGIGALVGAVTRTHPAGIFLALLVGGLMGAGIAAELGDEDTNVDENRVLTLSFKPEEQGWQVYHGPYRDYAKAALHPALASETSHSTDDLTPQPT